MLHDRYCDMTEINIISFLLFFLSFLLIREEKKNIDFNDFNVRKSFTLVIYCKYHIVKGI